MGLILAIKRGGWAEAGASGDVTEVGLGRCESCCDLSTLCVLAVDFRLEVRRRDNEPRT